MGSEMCIRDRHGVSIKVKKAEKVNPQTTAKDIGFHHSATLPPTSISLASKSTPNPDAKGSKPITVVEVVKIIGLNLCEAVLIITSLREIFSFSLLNLLNVSTKTILLFTTIPAKAIIPRLVKRKLIGV